MALGQATVPPPDSLRTWMGRVEQLYESGDYAQSAKLARVCIEAAEKQQIKGIIGKAYYYLARGSFQLQDYDKGMEYARMSLRTSQQEADANGTGDAFLVTATLLLATNRLDSAFYYGAQAVNIYQKAGNAQGMASAYLKQGHVFNIKGEYAKATPYYRRSYELSSPDTLSVAFMSANLSLASNYIYLKRPDPALIHVQQAYRIANKRRSFYEQSTALYYLSGIYELKGDFPKALAYERRYAEVRDSVLNHERIRQVKELEVRYEATEKENAIQLLQKNKLQQRAVLWAALATLALLLLVALQIYRSYRQRTDDNKKLAAANTSLEAENIKTTLQLEAEARERERLNEMDAFKSRFFTNITHEFRTPLTVILGMTERMLSDVQRETTMPSQRLLQPLTLVKRNGENLLRLINQILDLAKLESNTLKMNYIQGDVLAYLRYIAESMHSLSNTRNVLLRVESSQANIMADYDPERLQQITHNLLSNAIKFTPSGGKVRLVVEPEMTAQGDKILAIKVADTGAGIPSEDLPRIFDRFFQASNQVEAQSGGTGIGLSLTKELVRALGGTIGAESRVGVGTTFTVRLPLTNKAEKASALPLPTPNPVLPGPAADTKGTAHADSPRLLLVEDNPDVVEYLSACLGDQYQLDYAYNGRAGIEKGMDTVPDIVISDVMMPDKDGYALCDALKSDLRTSHIPIVLLTAKAAAEDRIAGLRRGADAYLTKPFQRAELLVVLEGLLENRRRVQTRYGNALLQPQSAELPQAETAETAQEAAFLQKIRLFVEAELGNPRLSLDDICREAGMGRSNLHLKFSALAGMPPMQYVRTLRLAKSKNLLATGDMNVSEVAFEVGFDDPKYFSRLFSEAFGMPPAQWRKSG